MHPLHWTFFIDLWLHVFMILYYYFSCCSLITYLRFHIICCCRLLSWVWTQLLMKMWKLALTVILTLESLTYITPSIYIVSYMMILVGVAKVQIWRQIVAGQILYLKFNLMLEARGRPSLKNPMSQLIRSIMLKAHLVIKLNSNMPQSMVPYGRQLQLYMLWKRKLKLKPKLCLLAIQEIHQILLKGVLAV